MIVVYRGSPILWHLLARWVVRTRTYSLVNLASDRSEHESCHDVHLGETIAWQIDNEYVRLHHPGAPKMPQDRAARYTTIMGTP